MKKITLVLSILFALFLLTSCSKDESAPASASADLPHATVMMKDGSTVSGTVSASTPSDITLNLDGGGARTISMKLVKSVNYGDAPAAPAAVSDDSHADHHHPEQAAIETKTFQLEPGTEVPVRNEETIDSAKAVEGQTYAAEITASVRDANGAVVIPKGANAQIVIRSSEKGGKIRGSSDLVLDLQSVSIGGQQYTLSTTDLAEKGRSGVGANKRTGEFVGGGAAIGGIIGAITGGGKGAAIGAGAGAGGGALGEILTKGSAIRIPAETVITFKLDQPLRVVERR